MNRTEKFVLNSFSAAILQIVTMISGIIIPHIMLVSYGSEINGLITSINQFIGYFNLVEAGLAAAAIYALYSPLAEKNHFKINSIVSAARKFYIQSGCIFLVLVIGLALLYPIFVKSDFITNIEMCVLVLILGMSGILEFFTLSKYRVLLTADQKTYIISFTSCLVMILNTIIIFILGFIKVNVVLMRIVVLSTVFLRSIILYLYVNFKYPYLDFSVKPDKSALNKRWDALYQQLLGCVQNGAPVVIATFFTTLSNVSIYSIYSMVVSGINSIMSIFTSGLAASFGEIIAKKDKELLKKTYTQFEYSYYIAISIVYTICFIMINDFIKLYVMDIADAANYCIPLYGALFTINGFLYNVKTPQGMLIISAGMYKETRWRSTIQAALIIIVGVILTPFWGIVGIMIGLCVSNIYRTIDLLFFVPKNITHLSKWSTLKRMIRIVLNFFVIYYTSKFISIKVTSYLMWILKSIIVGLYTVFVVTFTNWICEKENFLDVLMRLKRMVGKRVGKTCK